MIRAPGRGATGRLWQQPCEELEKASVPADVEPCLTGQVRAELDLAEERLRISRDLHDVFGRTLATISVKSELASELSRRGRQDRAAHEMAEVRRIAESAGTEVRRVVGGELRTTWTTELDGARSLLDSAGIRCVVTGEKLVHPCTDTLAWVVREGVTNILRHADASNVTIASAMDEEELVVTLSNDGAGEQVQATGGTGLLTMADRMEAIGGAIEHHLDGDWFILQATVPTTTEAAK